MGLRRGEEMRAYKKGRAEVFDALLKAMDGLRMKISEKDEAAGTISAVRGLNFFSAGTSLTVAIKENEGEVAVTITSEPRSKITLIDYGQGSRDIRKIFDRVEETLGVTAVRTTAASGEGQTEEGTTKCPSCGKPVLQSAKFCTSCGAKMGN